MESFPRFNRTELDADRKIKSLKEPFVDVFTKLREKITQDKFDVIISDDTGARIQTLIFRKIYNTLNDSQLDALFVATGQSYYPKTAEEEDLLQDYLVKNLHGAKHVVLVTQYVHSGDTVLRLNSQLKRAGCEKVTVVALEALATDDLREAGIDVVNSHTFSNDQHEMVEDHQLLSAVAKNKEEYNPSPMRLDRAIETGQLKKSAIVQREEYKDFVSNLPESDRTNSIVYNKISALDEQPFTNEERSEIQTSINYTRRLVNDVAEVVVAELKDKRIY